MFTLQELRAIQDMTRVPGVGTTFAGAHIAASIHQKLIDHIAELETVENRQRAASQLRVIGGKDANATSENV